MCLFRFKAKNRTVPEYANWLAKQKLSKMFTTSLTILPTNMTKTSLELKITGKPLLNILPPTRVIAKMFTCFS